MRSFLCLIAMVGVMGTLHAAEMRSIQVKEAPLREKPSFLGKITVKLPYATRVQLLETKGTWVKIDDKKGHTGWAHASSVVKKKLKLKTGKELAQASSDEIALAGKGLQAKKDKAVVEANFAKVDTMESYQLKPEALVQFLKDGKIDPGTDGGANHE